MVRDMVKEGAVAALAKCFASRMEFGTAGLRAAMGAGTSRMNDLTIIQTTQVRSTRVYTSRVWTLGDDHDHLPSSVCPSQQGLCRYLEESFGDLKERGVVIGYDARAHPPSGGSSRRFAGLAAAVFIGRGVPVHLFSDITPTPFVVKTSQNILGIQFVLSCLVDFFFFFFNGSRQVSVSQS